MIPLKKPEFDLLTAYEIFTKLKSTPQEFGNLIREKSKDSTVVYLERLLNLKEALEGGEGNLSNVALILKHLNSSIENGIKLKEIRLLQSHHQSINPIAENLSSSLIKLAEEFDKCH
jgi:hypothetical protein